MSRRHYIAAGLLVAGLTDMAAGAKINNDIQREITETKTRYAQVGRVYEIERMTARRIDTLNPEFAEETRGLIDELREIKTSPDFERSKQYYDEVTGDLSKKYGRKLDFGNLFEVVGLFTVLVSIIYLSKK